MTIFLLLILPATLLLYVAYLILKTIAIFAVALIKIVFSRDEEIQLGTLDKDGKVVW